GDEPTPAPGLGRLVAVAVTAAREAVGPSVGYVAVGLAFTGLLSGLLPHGSLSRTMRHDDPWSTALMTAIALPMYSGPLQGMMKLGLMFEHGNSVGASFALFELGIGVNVGLVAWLAAAFGGRRVLAWVGLVAVATVALGYAAERPLYFAKEEASHTHAFDEWTSPFPGGDEVAAATVRDHLVSKADVLEVVALAGLAGLALLGAAAGWLDPAGRVEAWLPEARPRSVWDVDVPGPVLGAAALAGLVGCSVAALYVYYPAPREAFAEIVRVRTEAITAVRTGRKEEAIRQLERWDLLTRKVQVGVFLRTGALDPEVGKATEDLRERLEEMRDALLADDLGTARGLILPVEDAYRKCRDGYRPDGP
ncbi:MAG: permease, partial [Gemmataceae bacterium]